MDNQTWYIVRGDRSGVFFGHIADGDRNGREVRLTEVRCTWYWDGAATLLQLAEEGTKAASSCKFTMTIPELTILDAIEIIPCSARAAASIRGVDEWKR